MNRISFSRITHISLLVLFFPLGALLTAQESPHNRMAVQDQHLWQTNLGLDFSILPIINGAPQAFLSTSPSVDVIFQNRWALGLSLPVYYRLPLTTADMLPFRCAPGDLSLNGAWIFHSNRSQHRLTIAWTLPTGIPEDKANELGAITTGGLLQHLSLAWQYTRYTDPVSINIGMSLASTIPTVRAGGPYWESLTIGCTTGTTILMNRWVALDFSLAQRLALPPRSGNDWLSTFISYSAILQGSLWYTTQNHSFALELSHDMAKPAEGLGISFRYVYSIKPKAPATSSSLPRP